MSQKKWHFKCQIITYILAVLMRDFFRGGIFAVKMLTFSGKSAEKVMGVNGFDCPAIFWVQECSAFWGVVEGVLEH